MLGWKFCESCRADCPPWYLEKLPTPKHNALTATCCSEPNIIAAEIQVTDSDLLDSCFALFASDGISTSPTQLRGAPGRGLDFFIASLYFRSRSRLYCFETGFILNRK
jgi:hypothetical protein